MIGTLAQFHNVNSVIPQGFVWMPLLSLNSLRGLDLESLDVDLQTAIFTFVDDTNLDSAVNREENGDQLQEDRNRLTHWAGTQWMIFNAENVR